MEEKLNQKIKIILPTTDACLLVGMLMGLARDFRSYGAKGEQIKIAIQVDRLLTRLIDALPKEKEDE